MSFVFANNVSTKLASAITSTATTITLSSSANLPTLSSGEQMPLTLLDAATKSIYEICYVTAISGTSLTVIRAQEGTTASAYNAGDYAFSGPTAGTVFPVDGQTIDVVDLTVSGTAIVPPATASNQAVNLGQFIGSLVGNGYFKFPNGLIIQWAPTPTTSSTSPYTAAVIFPIAFPNDVLRIVASDVGSGVDTYSCLTSTFTATGFTIQSSSASGVGQYVAIGY